MTLTQPLPRLTEQERIEEWTGLYQFSTLSDNFAALLEKEAARYVGSDRDRATRQWVIGALLAEGDAEATNKEQYWQEALAILNRVAGGWAAFSESNVKRWARTVERCEHIPDLDRYRAVLPFEFFAAAGEMVNTDRYEVRDIVEPLDWAIRLTVENNAPTVSQMREAFIKDEHAANPWNQFRDGIKSLADKYLDQLPASIQPLLRALVTAIDAAERLSHE